MDKLRYFVFLLTVSYAHCGCLVKDGFSVNNCPKTFEENTASSSDECRELCDAKIRCHGFKFSHNICFLCENAINILFEKENHTSGICVRVVPNKNYPNFEHKQDLWCNDDEEEYIFPFNNTKRDKIWTPIDIIHEPYGLPHISLCFSAKEEFENCKPCTDKSARKGFIYGGFPLKNKNGDNYYSGISLDDCQELCRVTEYCHYFNYITSETKCFLTYGMGTKMTFRRTNSGRTISFQNDFFGFKDGTGSRTLPITPNTNPKTTSTTTTTTTTTTTMDGQIEKEARIIQIHMSETGIIILATVAVLLLLIIMMICFCFGKKNKIFVFGNAPKPETSSAEPRTEMDNIYSEREYYYE